MQNTSKTFTLIADHRSTLNAICWQLWKWCLPFLLSPQSKPSLARYTTFHFLRQEADSLFVCSLVIVWISYFKNVTTVLSTLWQKTWYVIRVRLLRVFNSVFFPEKSWVTCYYSYWKDVGTRINKVKYLTNKYVSI